MNYAALIQNRKSTREFTDKPVSAAELEEIIRYFENDVRRLVPEIGAGRYRRVSYNSKRCPWVVGEPQRLRIDSEAFFGIRHFAYRSRTSTRISFHATPSRT